MIGTRRLGISGLVFSSSRLQDSLSIAQHFSVGVLRRLGTVDDSTGFVGLWFSFYGVLDPKPSKPYTT